ncbi:MULTISPECIES: hypothetical protein [unclassified Acidovorax]|uniref:hypothetical protein n=1 Tax=unclassified Acidovorax TaxID=2684926 RepID=UPI001C474128|nr:MULTISPECIES: hypothetical protein [unclassified Acidovorax]
MSVHLNAARLVNVGQAAIHPPASELERRIQRFLGKVHRNQRPSHNPAGIADACAFFLDSW